MYAQRSAQEAYVESLQRMTVEQLIAEVMRVQIAAAELIKAEVANEREACAALCEEYDSQGGASLKDCIDGIRSRGEESVTH